MELTIEEIYNIVGILDQITEDASYDQCKEIDLQLNKIGYSANYGLDAEIYSITKI